MLGLVALGLTAVMIYTLVKIALIGKQLSLNDKYHGTIELILPVTAHTVFPLAAWQHELERLKLGANQLKIHVLVDGHHPLLNGLKELSQKFLWIEIHSFPMRPKETPPIPWMIAQISPLIREQVIIIGDAELVPNEHAFLSTCRWVSEKNTTFFVLPQTAKLSLWGEAIAVLNPTLALASCYGFRKWRRNLSHPLMGMAQGWLAMPLAVFKDYEFKTHDMTPWKTAFSKKWDTEGKTYLLAFGEKHLKRFYPQDIKEQIFQMQSFWSDLWQQPDRTGFGLYLVALSLWSFPIVCLFTHPFWALASFMLLILYRFFSKIVFQETWISILLHPFGCLVWIGTFFYWAGNGLRSRYGSQAQSKI